MLPRPLWQVVLLIVVVCLLAASVATAQLFSGPSNAGSLAGELTSLRAVQTARIDPVIFQFNTEHISSFQVPDNSVSKLDLKASNNARHEYDTGYALLLRRQFPAAIQHLARAISLHPDFVAAHNALGIAYLNAGQIQQAHEEFARAVALDGHLPGSYLNLGCAQIQLQRYAEAEESLKKATSMAPMEMEIFRALAYAQFKNRNYPALMETARQVHRQKHEEAVLVHLLAAAAWEAQDRLGEARDELETLLSEDPKSPLSGQVRKIIEQVKAEQALRAQMKRAPADLIRAESGALVSTNVSAVAPLGDANSGGEQSDVNVAHQVIRVTVNEVAMLFAVTDHGKSVTDLTVSDVTIRDDCKPPEAVLGFHNVNQLPLRIGLIIDMSNSITQRFVFEEAAASKFLETAVTDKDDLAFVIGFNCAVLLAQDFTPDKTLTARALAQLAPGGGTALWDAVAYGADKLVSHPETGPVARILVVISDGEDNSSSVSLQHAMWKAQRGEVAVYTVSTKEGAKYEPDPLLGNRGLKKLSEETAGTTFTSGSLSDIGKRLADLQEVLRGRYLVYYSPASHQPDGRYHAVEIAAEKNGHKYKVVARRGYYASALINAGIQ